MEKNCLMLSSSLNLSASGQAVKCLINPLHWYLSFPPLVSIIFSTGIYRSLHWYLSSIALSSCNNSACMFVCTRALMSFLDYLFISLRISYPPALSRVFPRLRTCPWRSSPLFYLKNIIAFSSTCSFVTFSMQLLDLR